MKALEAGTSSNGLIVYYDPVSSHASTHLSDTPHLLTMVREILQQIEVRDNILAKSFDLGRIVGKQDLVETDKDDRIIYAKRRNRETYTRFCLSRQPIPSSVVTLIIERKNNIALLASAWIGPLAPPFPGDENEVPESRQFWSRHALAWGNQEVEEASITINRPW